MDGRDLQSGEPVEDESTAARGGTAGSGGPPLRPELAERLGLEAHPEGGWFRRTWTTPVSVETANGPRATASAIQFLLAPGEDAAWHVVRSDELWLWHGPGTLHLQFGGSGAEPDDAGEVVTMDSSIPRVQLLIPAGVWQRALPVTDTVLATCVVSPEFSFDDWRLAEEV
ncbi:cupin domain-containing protein [Rarobacter faecitabidus]|uniref:DUF985 domain-containing protein n=1 Tax=Rarobacter faecitabidus TaxID=13243 RepID=A0A542ZPA7_RARFA|nr:cupin domain-containing protein [Rarobacter faecitabidus]TQL62188.1 hypothetical protein FB461_1827 [Rarobacter faecitabidus]